MKAIDDSRTIVGYLHGIARWVEGDTVFIEPLRTFAHYPMPGDVQALQLETWRQQDFGEGGEHVSQCLPCNVVVWNTLDGLRFAVVGKPGPSVEGWNEKDESH